MTTENICSRLAGLAHEILALRPDIAAISITNTYRSWDTAAAFDDVVVNYYGNVDDISLDGIAPVRRLEREASGFLRAVDYEPTIFENVELRVSREETDVSVSNSSDTIRIVRWSDAADIGNPVSGRHEYVLSFSIPEQTSGHELLSLRDISNLDDLRSHATSRAALRQMEEDSMAEPILEYIGTLPGETPASACIRDVADRLSARILVLSISAAPGDTLVKFT